MTLSDPITQRLALGAQSGVAFLGAHQPGMQFVESMLQVRNPDVAAELGHWLCWCPRLGNAWLVGCGE